MAHPWEQQRSEDQIKARELAKVKVWREYWRIKLRLTDEIVTLLGEFFPEQEELRREQESLYAMVLQRVAYQVAQEAARAEAAAVKEKALQEGIAAGTHIGTGEPLEAIPIDSTGKWVVSGIKQQGGNWIEVSGKPIWSGVTYWTKGL